MRYCYQCGRQIGNNEKVYSHSFCTGTSDHIHWGNHEHSSSYTTSYHYTNQIICKECHQKIEEENKRAAKILLIFLIIAGIFVIMYLFN